MFYIYVLQSKVDDELYVGFTKDLKNRVKEHNNGQNVSTKKYSPWMLIYYEACLHKGDAERREKYLKTSQGRKMLKLRLKEYFHLKNHSAQ